MTRAAGAVLIDLRRADLRIARALVFLALIAIIRLEINRGAVRRHPMAGTIPTCALHATAHHRCCLTNVLKTRRQDPLRRSIKNENGRPN
jgi:hypothetical protein